MTDLNMQMRNFIMLTEACTLCDAHDDLPQDDVSLEPPRVGLDDIVPDLEALVFKLRAHFENQDGDLAMGIETGMSRAADMIESLIRRHTEPDEPSYD